MNGTWLAKTELPADKAIFGTFVQLSDKAEADPDLIENCRRRNRAAGSTAQQVGDLYASFMNEAKREAARRRRRSSRPRRIDAIKTTAELAKLVGQLSIIGLPGCSAGFIEADAGDPTKVALPQPGRHGAARSRLLPERRSEVRRDPREVPVDYLEKFFTLAGRPRAAADAKAVLALETELAKIQWTQVESRDAVKTYNKMPLAEDRRRHAGLRLDGVGQAAGHRQGARRGSIAQPSFFKGFAAMVPTTPLDTWKAWLAAQVITLHAPLPEQAVRRRAFEFFGKTLSGQQAQRPRWKRGVQLVNGSMGEALGQLYVEKHFPAASKARMETMIANLIEAYRQSITELDWMTPATKKEALAKLAKFSPKIAYPEPVARLQRAADQGRRSRRQRRARQPARDRVSGRQARQARRSRRVADDAADGERVLQPGQERDRVPRRDPAAAVLRRRRPTTR